METTRRALLKGTPAAAVALAAPVAAFPLDPVDRRAWDRAVADLAAVQAEDEEFTPLWLETWTRCKAECEAVPHMTLRPSPYMGVDRAITTADTHFVRIARDTLAKVASGEEHWDDVPSLNDQMQLMRETVEAADMRDLQVKAIRDRYNMDALDDRAEELGDLLADAQSKVMEVPAPDLAALRVKLLMLPDEKDAGMPAWSSDYVRQTFEDVKRLLPSNA